MRHPGTSTLKGPAAPIHTHTHDPLVDTVPFRAPISTVSWWMRGSRPEPHPPVPAPVPVGVPDAAPRSGSIPGRRLRRARVCIPATSRLPYGYGREENSGRATRQTTGRQLKRLPESHAANRATRRLDARDTLPLPAGGSSTPFPETKQETRPGVPPAGGLTVAGADTSL